MTKKVKEEKVADIPLGCTYLNLAATGNPFYGGCSGTFMNIIGDEATGKTVQAKTLFAECHLEESLDGYDFVYDNPENIDFFDDDFFGDELSERIKKPHSCTEDDDFGSRTIQDFKSNLWNALERPTIYILDSFDALSDDAEIEKMDNEAKGKKVSGSYGTGKAKGASELFRMAISRLQKTKSFLLVISQTRENINPMTMRKKTRNGGKALDFYACHVIWLARTKSLFKTVNGKKVEIGHEVKAKVSKNKFNGRKREAIYPLYLDYGVDSIVSGINCLQDIGFWGKKATSFESPWGKMSKQKLISHIEKGDYEEDFAEFVAEQWDDFEDKLKLKRKRKY